MHGDFPSYHCSPEEYFQLHETQCTPVGCSCHLIIKIGKSCKKKSQHSPSLKRNIQHEHTSNCAPNNNTTCIIQNDPCPDLSFSLIPGEHTFNKLLLAAEYALQKPEESDQYVPSTSGQKVSDPHLLITVE